MRLGDLLLLLAPRLLANFEMVLLNLFAELGAKISHVSAVVIYLASITYRIPASSTNAKLNCRQPPELSVSKRETRSLAVEVTPVRCDLLSGLPLL
jgi:hypothetical protein